MTEQVTSYGARAGTGSVDVFAAARWLDEMWNSSAKPVSPREIDWQCNTWGSGRGCGDWLDWGLHRLVAATFQLSTWRNREARDELVVRVPLERFEEIAALILRLGSECESWPWLDEDAEDRALEVAAAFLGRPVDDVAADDDLLEALRLI